MAGRKDTAQQHKIREVMREFKEGDLTSGTGRKVRDRRQAIAIALSEAGASSHASREHNLAARARLPGHEPSFTELYAEAKRRNLPGRSRMDKTALRRALGL